MADIVHASAAAIAAIAALVALVRLLVGPTAADRVVGLDVATICSVSLIGFLALSAARVVYLDVALVYALISFVGVVALARHLERGL